MLDLAQDSGGRRGPDERARVLVVISHIGTNRGDERWDAAEGAAPDPFARDLGEEAFDEIQPGGPRGSEVEVKPRVIDHPRLHRRMLVGAVVVQNEMDV